MTGTAPTLLGDIGGTNVRFALLGEGKPGPVARYRVADYPTLADAIRHFLSGRAIGAAALAVAGPVEAGRCLMTNHDWVVDGPALRAEFGLARVDVLNDFEAAAWSLPRLLDSALHRLAGGVAVADAPAIVLGPGTGLGLAAFVPTATGAHAIASEGGHGTLAASDEREAAILSVLRRRFGHVSAERVLSGPGIESLYRAVAAVDGASAPDRDAAAITAAGLSGDCGHARATLLMFRDWLAAFAGDMALAFGARGGVYIAGGIPPRILPLLDDPAFRARFQAKGRFDGYLAAIPIAVILESEPALLGLAEMAAR